MNPENFIDIEVLNDGSWQVTLCETECFTIDVNKVEMTKENFCYMLEWLTNRYTKSKDTHLMTLEMLSEELSK